MKKVVENGKIVEYYTESEVKMIVEHLIEITKDTFEKVGIKLDVSKKAEKKSGKKLGQ